MGEPSDPRGDVPETSPEVEAPAEEAAGAGEGGAAADGEAQGAAGPGTPDARLEALARALREIDDALDDDALDPDPARGELPDQAQRIRSLRDRLEREVLAPLDELTAFLDEPEAETFRRAAAHETARVAVLVGAAGDALAGRALLERAADIAPARTDLHAELDEALSHPREHALLVRARRLVNRGERDRAMPLVRPLLGGRPAPALVAAARRLRDAPRPLSGAPALFRLNGFGVGLYGERDRREDGTFVATYCVCALWIPIFPLTAYRVSKAGDDAYRFFAREPLGPVARAWRSVVAVGVVLAVAGVWLSSWLGSPERLAGNAIAAAEALEAAGDGAGALATDPPSHNDFLLARLAGDDDLRRLAAGAFAREELRLDLEIAMKLAPSAAAKEALDTWDRGAAAAAAAAAAPPGD